MARNPWGERVPEVCVYVHVHNTIQLEILTGIKFGDWIQNRHCKILPHSANTAVQYRITIHIITILYYPAISGNFCGGDDM